MGNLIIDADRSSRVERWLLVHAIDTHVLDEEVTFMSGKEEEVKCGFAVTHEPSLSIIANYVNVCHVWVVLRKNVSERLETKTVLLLG